MANTATYNLADLHNRDMFAFLINTELDSGDSDMQFIMDPRYPSKNFHMYLDKHSVAFLDYDN